MTVKLLTEHNLEFLSLKGGCTGLSESTPVKCHIVENHTSRLRWCGHYVVDLLGRVAINLSSGFPTERVSKQSPQLQRLARNQNFTCRKITYDTFRKANNEGAYQTARMRRLVCGCAVRKPPKTG